MEIKANLRSERVWDFETYFKHENDLLCFNDDGNCTFSEMEIDKAHTDIVEQRQDKTRQDDDINCLCISFAVHFRISLAWHLALAFIFISFSSL